MTSKQQFLPEKLSKFNSTLHSGSLIECHIKHIVRAIVRAVFALPPHPHSGLQNYSMLRPGYRRVRFLIPSVLSVYIEHIAIQCVQKKNGQQWIVCFKKTHHHGNDCKMKWLMYVYKSDTHAYCDHNVLNITSETFSCNSTTLAMLSCFAWFNANDKTNLLLNVWNWKWPLLPSIHHMRNMPDYFLTILCTCLTYMSTENLDFFLPFLHFCSNLTVPLFR